MNTKYPLFQISVFLLVSLTTLGAVHQVHAKLDAQAEDSTYADISAARRISVSSYKMAALVVTPTITSNTVKISALIKSLPAPIVPTSTFQGPGAVVVPILLYHRIDGSSTDSQYYVSPDKFEGQLKLLRDWGYTTITTELLVKAIDDGADLPLHPILITFDDGHLDNYKTAFPIMQKYGFTGVIYIIGDYMGTPEYMDAAQIKEMAIAGWEVGSHSMTHPDLTSLNRQQQQYEIIESRKFLEDKLGMPVLTFAYPFGESDSAVINLTYSAGYIAAMGLGSTHNQRTSNLFALQRRGVDGRRDLNFFASFLPWQGDVAYLQVDNSISFRTNTLFP